VSLKIVGAIEYSSTRPRAGEPCKVHRRSQLKITRPQSAHSTAAATSSLNPSSDLEFLENPLPLLLVFQLPVQGATASLLILSLPHCGRIALVCLTDIALEVSEVLLGSLVVPPDELKLAGLFSVRE
jgi:hypothetical protein